MEFVELKKHLKSVKPSPCYFLYGDDSFLIERAVSFIAALAAEPAPFNCADREFDSAKALGDELMLLPITGEYRVVVARGKVDMPFVEKYLKDPNGACILVLPVYVPHDSWNRQTAVSPPAGATAVDCNRLAALDAALFIRAAFARTGASASDKIYDLIYRRCGGYMTRINSESQKLAAFRAGDAVTERDVNDTIEPDAEFIVFELCDSILAGNTARALTVVDGMAKNNDLVAAVTLVYNRFRKIFAAAVSPEDISLLGVKPFMAGKLKSEGARYSKARLRRILAMLENADYSYKTGASSVYDALVSFVVRASGAV